MQVDPESLTAVHNLEENRFEIRVGSYLAELKYRLQGETITFMHTGMPSALEGQGVGSMLVKSGLEYARKNGLKVEARCPFVAAYLQRHPE